MVQRKDQEQAKQLVVSLPKAAAFSCASCPFLSFSCSWRLSLDPCLLSLLSSVNCLPQYSQTGHSQLGWQLVDSHKSVLASRSTLNRHNSSHCSRRRHRNSHHIPSPNHPQLKRRLTDNHSHSRSNHRHNSCHRRSNHIKQAMLLLVWVLDIGK